MGRAPSCPVVPLKTRFATLTATDGLLLISTVIWGANYSLVKLAVQQIPSHLFNVIRLVIAACLFVGAIVATRGGGPLGRPRPGSWRADAWSLTAREWLALAGLGLVGHLIYQLGFIGSISRSSASNTALILGCSPVAVALLTAAVGHERVSRWHWAGAALSVLGIYALAGRGAALSNTSFRGDMAAVLAVCCWATYTVGSKPLLARHSPMVVTGLSMTFGALFYLPLGLAASRGFDWSTMTAFGWTVVVYSGVFSLFVGYLIWYTSVQRIGNLRTSVYSNLTPLLSILIASAFIGERLTPAVLAGAAAILGGVALTRIAGPPPDAAPPEE